MMYRSMKVMGVNVLGVLVLSLVAQAQQPKVKPIAPNTFVKVAMDRTDALYHVGEKATFSIELKPGEQAAQVKEVTYDLSLDGVPGLGKGTLALENGKASVTGSLDKPGILRCTATPAGDAKLLGIGMAAAAFDPLKIEPTAVMPADFDAFWDAQKAELAKIPVDAKLEQIKQPSDKIKVFKITIANINNSRVHGYFGKPKGEGRYPAILSVPGAGVRSASMGYAAAMAASGFLAMDISVHDMEDGQPEDYYKKLWEGPLKGYPHLGEEDRTTYYFRRVILGIVRSVDYLTSRPEWDKKHTIINGSSQGGALSLIGAGVDPRITALAANVPAMCDHSGRAFGRPSGWPQLVPVDKDKKLDPKVLAVSGYYDAVNFARKISAPAIVGVGLIDQTCPATTVFSAYNSLRGPKQIDIAPLMGHSGSASYGQLKERWIRQQAGIKK